MRNAVMRFAFQRFSPICRSFYVFASEPPGGVHSFSFSCERERIDEERETAVTAKVDSRLAVKRPNRLSFRLPPSSAVGNKV